MAQMHEYKYQDRRLYTGHHIDVASSWIHARPRYPSWR